ncbi:MAG: type IV toxin-antitoxin system AbiEi family antitoxin domain-containing protein [Solirubrobacteraceae bacterium]
MSEAGRKTGTCGGFLNPPPIDVALAALASQQHAVFGLEQLRGLGLNDDAVHQRAASGRLHRVHRGVYALVPPELLTREGRWLAAVLACGPGAVLSHRSAAALLELRPRGASRIDVTVPSRSRRERPGIDIHRSTTLEPTDTMRARNIPCTTFARPQLDLAEVIDRRGLERAFDQAEILERFDLRALQNQLARNSARPCSSLVRAVLDEHYPGATVTWSELEERFLALCVTAGLPLPEVNAWIVLPDGGPALRVDFAWRAQRVVVETDGHAVHRTRQAFERDKQRDLRLTLARWRPLRLTWRQIVRQAETVAATMVAVLRA